MKNMISKPKPITKLEKIINIMQKINIKLNEYKEESLAEEAEWAINELLKGQLFSYSNEDNSILNKSKFENDQEHMFLNHFYFNQNINPEIQLFETISPIEPSSPSLISSSKLQNIKFDEFGPNFDIFNYSDMIGREKVLLTITKQIFSYKDLNKFIKNSIIDDFLAEIRLGYTLNQSAIYHNVYIYLNLN